MIRYDFTSHDGKVLSVVEWLPKCEPKGIIQISHGMAEHAMRYDAFARFLCEKGYIVFADDHRAHGKTDENTLGYADGDIFSDTLKDIALLTEHYKKKYNLNAVLFAHSYGSFIGQRYLQEYSSLVKGVVLSGSNKMPSAGIALGNFLSGGACALGLKKKPANFIKKLTFGMYDKQCGGSFISSLKDESERYAADNLCGFVCSYAFYKYFFKGLKECYKKLNLNKLTALPIMIVSGKNDPVGEMGKGVGRLEDMYLKRSLCVKKALYNGARHEYLNDICKETAMNDILKFIDEII